MLHEDDGDWAKRELLSLGADIATIPEKLDDYYFTHYTREGSPTEKELVFADIEFEIDDSRSFTSNLICCKRESSEAKYHFWGKSCIRQFIGQLMEWTKEKKESSYTSFFHNFRGFDGLFIIKQLYDMNVKVSQGAHYRSEDFVL